MSLLTIRQLIGVLASPTLDLKAIVLSQENSKFEERASDLFVTLETVGEISDTLSGVMNVPSVFNVGFTDREVQAAAKTFEE